MALGRIVEVKQTLSGDRHEFECDLLERHQGVAAVLYRLPEDRMLHGVALRRGDLSIGYFWESRPYNVYHFLSTDGQTRVFYINICDSTHISARQIHWRDLIVDILMAPDGDCQVLDEDELPPDLAPEIAGTIADARDDILVNRHALRRQWEERSGGLMRHRL